MELSHETPSSLILAAALALGTVGASVAPAAAQPFGVTVGVGGWDNDSWHDVGWRSRHHHRHHRDRYSAPGFSFSFGMPYRDRYSYYQPRRHYGQRQYNTCWENWHGRVICQ